MNTSDSLPGACWWCHWGWPEPIQSVYEKAVLALDGDEDALHYGPAHIVWEDENWDAAGRCLADFQAWKEQHDGVFSSKELEIVRQSLVELVAIPDEYKQPPCEYDGRNPADFPPPSHWVMVRV